MVQVESRGPQPSPESFRKRWRGTGGRTGETGYRGERGVVGGRREGKGEGALVAGYGSAKPRQGGWWVTAGELSPSGSCLCPAWQTIWKAEEQGVNSSH